MERQSELKVKIFSILDEIVDINHEIILRNDKGLKQETLEGLRSYKNNLLFCLNKMSMLNSKN